MILTHLYEFFLSSDISKTSTSPDSVSTYATQFRRHLNQVSSYQALLRDDFIKLNGQEVRVAIPEVENSTDEYSEFDEVAVSIKYLWMIPKFDRYYAQISVLGSDYELDLPLNIISRISDNIPRNSILELPTRNNDGLILTRKWRVISSENKHLDNTYTRILNCVPFRSTKSNRSY